MTIDLGFRYLFPLFPFQNANKHYKKVTQQPYSSYFQANNVMLGLDYLQKEVFELQEAVMENTSPAHIQEELGDVLMTASRVGFAVGANPNKGMHDSEKKVEKRLNYVLTKKPQNQTQFDAVWAEAKKING
jgi:uncharacterized protein YabN with tetrapyrrole methylase and pyrophosphatase domain